MHGTNHAGRQDSVCSRRAVVGGLAGCIAAALLPSGVRAQAVARGGLPGLPHHAPKAKRLVVLWQGGGPSHVDLYDHKPLLATRKGEDIPESVRGATRLSTMSSGYSRWPAQPAIRSFRRWGGSGLEISELLPHIGSIADELCLVRSMRTDAVNHSPGVTFALTGSQLPGRPSAGAWLDYGLGSACDDLPSYVVMTSSDEGKTCGQLFYEHYWSNGFLPGRHQGVRFRQGADPVPYLASPAGSTPQARRALLDGIAALDAERARRDAVAEAAFDTRRAQYELALRMQSSVPGLLDLSSEPDEVVDAYGPSARKPGTYAHHCLLARRLVERGARCVQLMHSGWDQHDNLHTQLELQCRDTDQPSAALVLDLKRRGLLDETLVVWAGEFGRTPFGQGPSEQPNGRDHFGRAFSLWLAGGGVRAGHVHGETDEWGWNIVRDPLDFHDLQATILHLFGIDHERLVYRHQGRQFRLTDVHGKVARGLLA